MQTRVYGKVNLTCAVCSEPFAVNHARAALGKARYCSRACADKGQSTPITKTCPVCGKEFTRLVKQGGRKRKACSKSCARKAFWADPARKAKARESIRVGITDEARRASSERMKLRNPMSDPEAREKMRRALQGRTFLARGGNGQLTRQQIALAAALQWPTECVVLTAPVKDKFPSLPNCYKVDLGHPGLLVSVEIDGKSHNLPVWKFLDRRKTEVLAALGWTVLRFTNKQVDEELALVAAEVYRFAADRFRRIAADPQRQKELEAALAGTDKEKPEGEGAG